MSVIFSTFWISFNRTVKVGSIWASEFLPQRGGNPCRTSYEGCQMSSNCFSKQYDRLQYYSTAYLVVRRSQAVFLTNHFRWLLFFCLSDRRSGPRLLNVAKFLEKTQCLGCLAISSCWLLLAEFFHFPFIVCMRVFPCLLQKSATID